MQVATTKHREAKKKFLLASIALVGLAGVFSGCSKDEPNKPTKKEEVNKAPIITSIDFEKTTFALNQVAIVKATVTDPENDPISLSWSSGTADFGKGQELELRFASVGEKEITLKATDTKGNAATKSSRINVIDPDFGFALWGDKLDIIKRSETGKDLGDNAGVIYHFLGNGYDRYYTFDNDILVSGIQERVYTPKVLQATQYAIAWTLYEEELQKLSDRFGQPASITYSVQPTGNKSEDGLALINGAGIEAKFLSTRTKATLTVYRKGATTVCYKTNFSASK